MTANTPEPSTPPRAPTVEEWRGTKPATSVQEGITLAIEAAREQFMRVTGATRQDIACKAYNDAAEVARNYVPVSVDGPAADEAAIERLAQYREDWLWHEATDDLREGYGAHMGQLLYRLPRDGQTDDMKASIESMIAALAAAVPASPTDTGDGLREAIEALADDWQRFHDRTCHPEFAHDCGVTRTEAAHQLRAVLAAHGGDA